MLVERQEEEQIKLEVQKCFSKMEEEQENELCKAAGSQPGHRVSQSGPQPGRLAGNVGQLAVLGEGKLSNAGESTVPPETQVP